MRSGQGPTNHAHLQTGRGLQEATSEPAYLRPPEAGSRAQDPGPPEHMGTPKTRVLAAGRNGLAHQPPLKGTNHTRTSGLVPMPTHAHPCPLISDQNHDFLLQYDNRLYFCV